jgi:spermidine synthase
VLTLLTNGKFQGDNGSEMKSQYGFSLYPLLHTSARDSALVIGLGTGVSAATVHRAGFKHVDIAELSADLAALTDRYFAGVNGAILHEPGVSLHVTDGRNFLLLTKNDYDLVTIEVTSIWFAGAASLYSSEFYRLVHEHLRPHGVLQQWIQLHHISGLDITSVLSTVHHEFPFVSLYFSGAQGVIVACTERCEPNRATLAAIDGAAGLQPTLTALQATAADLERDRLLSPNGVDQFIPQLGGNALGLDDLMSTDDNLLLDYSTPRGNVLDYGASLIANLALLRPFAADPSGQDQRQPGGAQ